MGELMANLMANVEQYFIIYLMVLIALVDRYGFRRTSVVLEGIGKGVVKGSAIAFPVSLNIRHHWFSNAQVEYWLQDQKNPTFVIAGRKRTVAIGKCGRKEEYLLIDTKYLEEGEWDLKVKITNGNCRLNPLYRISPIYAMAEKTYTITVNGQEGWHVE